MNISYHIGKEAGRLDVPPYRAYFVWMKEGQIYLARDFSERELREYMQSESCSSDEQILFQRALEELKRHNAGCS